jgi:Na+-translocating ferredoxin:NAD+ oxidoreductase RnfG subunit
MPAARYLPFLLAPVGAAIVVSAYARTYLSVEQAQQAIFPGARFDAAPLTLTPEQAREVERRTGVSVRTREVRAWKVAGGGWFVVDEVIGKHELITYAVGLDARGAVTQIEVLDYRESYGHEIRDAGWRAQFAGKTAAAPLTLDADVRNISGATLSCRHIADGVKRVLATHEVALRDGGP